MFWRGLPVDDREEIIAFRVLKMSRFIFARDVGSTVLDAYNGKIFKHDHEACSWKIYNLIYKGYNKMYK